MVRVSRVLVVGVAIALSPGCIDDFECGPECTGSSSDDATITELGTTYCTNIRDAECGTPELEAECFRELEQFRLDAMRDDCEFELHAYLRCAAGSRIECVTLDTFPSTTHASAEGCSERRVRFGECVSWVPPECGVFSSTSASSTATCGVSCSDFSSICEGASANGPVECTCDSGPNVGVTFEAQDCGSEMAYRTGHSCRY